jgi:threonine dehydratase
LTTGTAPGLRDIEAARARLDGVARVTPVFRSETFSRLAGREVSLKAENLQRTGSFKIRGAYNRISTLGDAERAAGVVAASAGNHGQAVAWAAREAGIQATIFVPADAPMAKVDATRSYGADVQMGGATFEEAVAAARRHVEETGATFVHAFEDALVVAGQGTIGLELADQVAEPGTVIVPVGGGGLAAGIALALRSQRPAARLVGVRAAREQTIADGIAIKHPGELSMSILEDALEDMVEVTDEEISEAIVLLLERTKLVVEGAGAVGVAALLAGRIVGSGPVLAILSGGNIDATLLMSVTRHGLSSAGRYLVVATKVPDRPGELFKLLSLVTEARMNVIGVEHRREGPDIGVTETGIELTLGTRDEEHCEVLLQTMRSWGYEVKRLT